MTDEEVVRKANETATTLGRDVDKYEAPRILKFEDRWGVFYKGKSLLPGDHFSVTISYATGEARLVCGR